MKKIELIERQFKELLAQGEGVFATLRNPPQSVGGDRRVDQHASQEWGTRTLAFMRRIFGKDSEYSVDFKKSFTLPGYESDMRLGMAVLQAAWKDYSSGYLSSVNALITAEVFDDFLEQATYLCRQDYYQAAAVIAGAVLEDTLRKMCDENSIFLPPKPGLDWMNAELAKKGAYNKLVLKEVTFLADLRNKAAHGEWDQFGKSDVESMLKHVREFVTAQMA